jgi:glyoxylase-like metal-dependent hydrolase (beta-lactamase superfamily II)
VRGPSRARAVAAAVASVVALGGCASSAKMTIPLSEGVAVGTVKLSLSNVHVVVGARPLLVDTGTHGDLDDLDRGLVALGIDWHDIQCAVVTHVHADHAGLARALQARGIRIVAGRGDLDRARRGDHGALHSTGLKGTLLKPFIPSDFLPFTPDYVVDTRLDLRAPCGIAAEVIAAPGHTPGSLVVLAGGGRVALVGDLFRGSLICPCEPVEHFFQDDLAAVHVRIHELLARGVVWFALGHGGPAFRDDVAKAFQ